MTTATLIQSRRRPLLVQELERLWPGCGAHTKRDRIAWSELLPTEVHNSIHTYVSGWEAAMDAAVRLALDGEPFDETLSAKVNGQLRAPGPGRPHKDRGKSQQARANLDRLFGGQGGE